MDSMGLLDYYGLSITKRDNCWTLFGFQIDSRAVAGFLMSFVIGILFTFGNRIVKELVPV